MTPQIVRAQITPYPRPLVDGITDPMPRVIATFDDGTTKELFWFYPDELSFTPGEFVGLTEAEAHALRRRKDVDYLTGGDYGYRTGLD